MKKFAYAVLIILLISCSKEGEIQNQSTRTIKINGNEYRFLKVVPADGERAIWLLIPSKASVEIPQPLSYKVNCGKNCNYMLTSVWIKS